MTDTKQDICKADTIGVIGMNDLISRQAAIDEVLNLNVENRVSWRDAVIDTIDALPSAQQDCTECEDYDHETKSCPKFCDVIRKTLKEAKQERKTGRWIDYVEDGYVECPFCHSATNCNGNISELHFCFSCGAKMEEPEDIPMEYFESGGR